ncbi:MAG: PilZ domain-containing protein [Acidobacteriota bacterium]
MLLKERQCWKLVGKHPGHVGDLIIFWEVPDAWTILTRDSSFKILKEAHRKNLTVYKVRRPRLPSGRDCVIHTSRLAQPYKGILINYNSEGVRVKVPKVIVKPGEVVTITAPEFGDAQDGEVVYLDKKDKSVFALKFKFTQPKV